MSIIFGHPHPLSPPVQVCPNLPDPPPSPPRVSPHISTKISKICLQNLGQSQFHQPPPPCPEMSEIGYVPPHLTPWSRDPNLESSMIQS